MFMMFIFIRKYPTFDLQSLYVSQTKAVANKLTTLNETMRSSWTLNMLTVTTETHLIVAFLYSWTLVANYLTLQLADC